MKYRIRKQTHRVGIGRNVELPNPIYHAEFLVGDDWHLIVSQDTRDKAIESCADWAYRQVKHRLEMESGYHPD